MTITQSLPTFSQVRGQVPTGTSTMKRSGKEGPITNLNGSLCYRQAYISDGVVGVVGGGGGVRGTRKAKECTLSAEGENL